MRLSSSVAKCRYSSDSSFGNATVLPLAANQILKSGRLNTLSVDALRRNRDWSAELLAFSSEYTAEL